jgi:hypothetical protein
VGRERTGIDVETLRLALNVTPQRLGEAVRAQGWVANDFWSTDDVQGLRPTTVEVVAGPGWRAVVAITVLKVWMKMRRTGQGSSRILRREIVEVARLAHSPTSSGSTR